MPPTTRARAQAATSLRTRAAAATTTPAAPAAAATATPATPATPITPATQQTWPAALAADIATLSPAARGEMAKLMFLFGRDRDVVEGIRAALDDGALWPMRMSENDERRILSAAIGAVPLPARPATRPRTVSIVRATTNGTDAVPDALARLTRAYRAGDDVTIAPEWFFVPSGGVAMSEVEKDALVTALCALTEGSDRLLVPGTIPWRDERGGYHNTALAIADGAVLHAVDKRGDGDDVAIAAAAGLSFTHEPSAPTFAWRGLRVGLEICRDHGDARLRYDLLGAAPDHSVVDLQLVVSAGVWLKHVATGIGGATIVAQGDPSFAPEVAVREEGTLRHVDVPAGDVARLDLR